MIGRLRGVVVADEADGSIALDVGGVGYELTAPLGTVARARAAQGCAAVSDPITLYVHTHVREDALLLFGFAAAADKAAFRTLISISNVGPKMALAVLSTMTAGELARAVASKDVARLLAVPGVGKKSAERLVLELKDKLVPEEHGVVDRQQAAAPSATPSTAELLASALTRMGYRPSEAERAVSQLGSKVQTEPLQSLIRQALGLLSR